MLQKRKRRSTCVDPNNLHFLDALSPFSLQISCFSFTLFTAQMRCTCLSAALFSQVKAVVISITIKVGREITLDVLVFACLNIYKHRHLSL